MGLTLLTERYAPQIAAVLSCFDRILVFGTLPKVRKEDRVKDVLA